MKRIYPILSALLLLAACTESDTDRAVTQQLQNSPDFHATFESDDTRTFVDEKVRLLWTEGDLISIFTTTLNQKYEFDGETGDNSGTFTPISSGQFGSGSSLSVDANYAVYPYNQSTKISYDGELSIELPATQAYAEDSFGVNANTMVAVTQSQNDNFLSFKNLGGFLKLQLYGDVAVKSIHLEGNNGEKIAGGATVTAKYGKNPALSMDSDATTSITLDCGAGVKLGTSSSSATEFWIVVPPVTFSKGFTITITDTEGGTMTKSTTKSYTVERNVMKSMTAFEVETEQPVQILYTSTDGSVISPNTTTFGGAKIVSNVYENGQGVMTFDKTITSIPEDAFRNSYSLTSITIPDGVTQIGNTAFWGCSSIASITIPNGITHIGDGAFGKCAELEGVNIPNSIIEIGTNPFQNCPNITIIGKYVTDDNNAIIVGDRLVWGNPRLRTYDIPMSVKLIGDAAFVNSNLESVNIPNGVTIIGFNAFANSYALKNVAIPNTVMVIKGHAFQLTNIRNITIPDSVEYIDPWAFDIYAMQTVNCLSDTPPIVGVSIFGLAGRVAEYYSLSAIYVPTKAVGTYKAADGWKEYKSLIQGKDFDNGGEELPANQIWYTSSDGNIIEPTVYNYSVNTDEVNQIESNVYENGKGVITYKQKITEMWDFAFEDCSTLQSITIPNSVTTIASGAFSGSNLSDINIPDGVTSIGDEAFWGCKIQRITIPANVNFIGHHAFDFCRKLKTIDCKAIEPPHLDLEALLNCDALTAIYVPYNSVDKYKSADSWSEYESLIQGKDF